MEKIFNLCGLTKDQEDKWPEIIDVYYEATFMRDFFERNRRVQFGADDNQFLNKTSPKAGETCLHGRYKIVVSEVSGQDKAENADATAQAAQIALADAEPVELKIDDYEIECRAGMVSSFEDIKADLNEKMVEGVMANIAGMDDELTEEEQTSLSDGDAYLYVGAEAADKNIISENAIDAMEGLVSDGDDIS